MSAEPVVFVGEEVHQLLVLLIRKCSDAFLGPVEGLVVLTGLLVDGRNVKVTVWRGQIPALDGNEGLKVPVLSG